MSSRDVLRRLLQALLVELSSLTAILYAYRLGTDLLHQIYLLQQTLSQPTPNPDYLAGALYHISDAICRMIGDIQCSQEGETVTDDLIGKYDLAPEGSNISNDQLLAAGSADGDCIAITRVFPKLFGGLDRLGQLAGDIALEKRMIHCYIKIFRCLLERICHLSTTSAAKDRHQSPQRAQNTQTPKKMPKCFSCRERNLKCDQRASSCRYCKKKALNCDRAIPSSSAAMNTSSSPDKLPATSITKLCELTVTMMGYLDTTKAAHREILEGYLFFLFEKIGTGLRHFVFGSDEEDIGGDQAPDDDSSHVPQTSHNEPQAEDTATKAQAPYLIWILEQTQTFLHQQPHSTQPHSPAPPTPTTNVAAFARTKLQHTLLRAIFGNRAPRAYEPSLQPPTTPPDAELHRATMPEADVKDWYKHEVWRLLGWDVLRDHPWRDPLDGGRLGHGMRYY